jgi:hypothetical protein
MNQALYAHMNNKRKMKKKKNSNYKHKTSRPPQWLKLRTLLLNIYGQKKTLENEEMRT